MKCKLERTGSENGGFVLRMEKLFKISVQETERTAAQIMLGLNRSMVFF
jgi:hypothetical protein